MYRMQGLLCHLSEGVIGVSTEIVQVKEAPDGYVIGVRNRMKFGLPAGRSRHLGDVFNILACVDRIILSW